MGRGIVEEAKNINKFSESEDKSKSAGLRLTVLEFLSGISGRGIDGQLAQKVSKNLESYYKSIVHFSRAVDARQGGGAGVHLPEALAGRRARGVPGVRGKRGIRHAGFIRT